jgi:hypothetical protein
VAARAMLNILLLVTEIPFVIDLDLTQRFLTKFGEDGSGSALPS